MDWNKDYCKDFLIKSAHQSLIYGPQQRALFITNYFRNLVYILMSREDDVESPLALLHFKKKMHFPTPALAQS